MASTRQALIAHLRSHTALTALLGAGPDSIIVPGRLKQDTPTPCVIVRAGPSMGSARRLPNYQQLFECRVYYNPVSRAGGRWAEVDEILGHIRDRLHDADITVDDGILFAIKWDGFESSDMWDFVVEMYYRITRFRLYRVGSYW